MAYMTKITKRDKTEKSAAFAAVLQLGKYCLLQWRKRCASVIDDGKYKTTVASFPYNRPRKGYHPKTGLYQSKKGEISCLRIKLL